MGATAPVTLAGAVALAIAEGLLCLTLAQLRRTGTPCFLSANVSGFDMSTTRMSIAAPEMSLGLAAQAEVAQSFGLPTWGLAGSTDSKVLDAQAGIESAFSILAQGLGGLNLIHDVGYMDGGMVCSAEMLVMGDEVVGMAKRFIRGIEVNRDTLAREVVQQIGPGGNFIQHEHTFRHFRNELWRPSLLSRQSYDAWRQQGAADMSMRVRAKVKELLETHKLPPLPDKTLAALEKLKRDGEKELTAK
jgi:trimethylamine--corrinoid protein Co-methyltransferase